MSLISDMTQLQEAYRGLLRDLYKDGDQVELPAEDAVIAVCITHREMFIRSSGDPDVEPESDDIIRAIEFLDYLDTQNMAVRYKQDGSTAFDSDGRNASDRRWPGQR